MNKAKTVLRENNAKEHDDKMKSIDFTQAKTCTVCGESKELALYSVHKGTKSGYYSWCLCCSRKKTQKGKRSGKNIPYKIVNNIMTLNMCLSIFQ